MVGIVFPAVLEFLFYFATDFHSQPIRDGHVSIIEELVVIGAKEDAVAECVAISWKNYRTLFMQGRDPAPLVGKIAEFSTRKVRSGQGLNNINPLKDAMSERERHRQGYDIESLDEHPRHEPPDPSLPLDLHEWIDGLDDRQKKIVGMFNRGLNTVEVAERIGVSRMMIYILRKRMAASLEQRGVY